MRLRDRESSKIQMDDVIRNRPMDNCYKVFRVFVSSRNKYFYNHVVDITNCKKVYTFIATRRVSGERIARFNVFAAKLKLKLEQMIDSGMTNRDFDEWYNEGEWRDWV